MQDESRSGRLSTARTDESVDRIHDFVHSVRRLMVRVLGEQLNLTHTAVHQDVKDEFVIRKICSKMVSKNLSQEQNDIRREMCLDYLELTTFCLMGHY